MSTPCLKFQFSNIQTLNYVRSNSQNVQKWLKLELFSFQLTQFVIQFVFSFDRVVYSHNCV